MTNQRSPTDLISHDKMKGLQLIFRQSENTVLVTRVSHNSSFEPTMALKKLTSLLVVFACRFTLFLFISLLSCLLQGIPNINSCFLTVSIFNLRDIKDSLFDFLMG